MLGKTKCRILKQIRQRIADENDIPFVTRECSYQGQCRGTCPRCEQELRYLEEQLRLRRQRGKAVTVAALALSLSLSVGCEPEPGRGTEAAPSSSGSSDAYIEQVLEGEPAELVGTFEEDPSQEETEETVQLIGEVAYPGDEEELGGVPTETLEFYPIEGNIIEGGLEPIAPLPGDVEILDPISGDISRPPIGEEQPIPVPVEPTQPPVHE